MKGYIYICNYDCGFEKQINVIQHENVDAMPFWLSFFLFLNGGVWLVYGIIDRDMLIGVSIIEPHFK